MLVSRHIAVRPGAPAICARSALIAGRRALQTPAHALASSSCKRVLTHLHRSKAAEPRLASGCVACSSVGSDSASSSSSSAVASQRSAADVIRAFYAAVNAKDIDAAVALVAEDIEYQDFTYPEPKRGREAVRRFLQEVSSFVPDDLVYVIDDVTMGDDAKVGIVWHVELDGEPFPNARGCSFYRINDEGKMVWARDIVESPLKLGDAAIQLLGVLAPLVRRFGSSPKLGGSPQFDSAAVWLLYLGYSSNVMLNPALPGPPGIATPPDVFPALINMSLNFFYVNIAAAAAGLPSLVAPAEHPVYEGLFNAINAWSLMFLPVVLSDPRSRQLKYRLALWAGLFFGTNLFFIPYLALRAAQPPPPPGTPQQAPPAWAPLVGWTGAAVLAVSIPWCLAARPEFGDLAARADYFWSMYNNDRVFWAFILDAVLYCVWQAALLARAPARFRFLPFVGLAGWLIMGMPVADGKTADANASS